MFKLNFSREVTLNITLSGNYAKGVEALLSA